MHSVRNIIAVILSVAGLFLLVLGIHVLPREFVTVGAIFLVGGLVLAGLYAIADKLSRMEEKCGGGSGDKAK